MGHKGVSKRKPPKAKIKPLATANRGAAAVSSATLPRGGQEQPPEKISTNPASRLKKNRKKH